MSTYTLGEMPVRHVDGTNLFNPCHCGNRAFRTNRVLRYRTCEIGRCTACGQLRTIPEPDPQLDATIYSQETPKYSLSEIADPTRTKLWRTYAERILSELDRALPGRGRLLDIGCSFGDLLFAADAWGWEAEGVEINEGNAAHLRAQGLVVHSDPIERMVLEESRYDAVVFNQVLEHIHEPNEFLQGVKRVLRPGGVIFVGVPRFPGPIPLLLKRDSWYALLPTEHVWQFGVRSLQRLLVKHGFAVEREIRGCSEFWGKPSARPRDLARWTVYRFVDVTRQGDFTNVVARNRK